MIDLEIIKNLKIPNIIKEEILSKDSQITEFLDNKRDVFDDWFSDVIGSKIESLDSWVNYTKYKKNVTNGYNWHNEKGINDSGTVMDGDWVGIIWIEGNTNCGGNLSVIINDTIKEIVFEPNTAIIVSTSTFHRVEHYYGDRDRVSLNFTFNLK